MNTARTGDGRREEEFTDVTLVEKNGHSRKKGRRRGLGEGDLHQVFGDKSYRDKGWVDKEIQKFRRAGVRCSWTRSRRQGVADKGIIDKEFGQERLDKEFIGRDSVDKKSSPRRRST